MVFKFKQFSVKQTHSAMKIGTDSVLLGAWTPVEKPESILDIGAGTGLLALMLAQRCDATVIDAVEIDEKAYIECTENFEESEWGDRLFCYHASFQEFAMEMDERYDLIISNPPFYTTDYKTPEKARNTARFTDALSFSELLAGVNKLLSVGGVFSVILPYTETEGFITLASGYELYPQKITHTKGNTKSELKRSMLLLGREELDSYPIDVLIIEEERGGYTEAYRALTQDFYLNLGNRG
ncbi:tRNA1(Val) (adenine(37)-N6)-methyltransferase [Capnocytophaga sp. HP1101]